MTLVVARSRSGRLSIVADTMITEHDMPLPIHRGALKTICLPGYICVAYSGSPELAAKYFLQFSKNHPEGANFSTTVAFFEKSSALTNNDYIIAFGSTGKLVTIRDGRHEARISKTHWIGDAEAYKRFRQYEHNRGHQHEHGLAVDGVLFADEMAKSPASDLYSVMRNVLLDYDVPTVGGFVTVISNRDDGFRFSVYSDVLFDWPTKIGSNPTLEYSDSIDLKGSGEHDGYSINQISSGYYNANTVAFYHLKGKHLTLFGWHAMSGPTCATVREVEPNAIASTLDKVSAFPFGALCLVMSTHKEFSHPINRESEDYGLGVQLFCEVNTMKSKSH